MALAGKSWEKETGTVNRLTARTNNEPLDTLCELSGASRTGFRGVDE